MRKIAAYLFGFVGPKKEELDGEADAAREEAKKSKL